MANRRLLAWLVRLTGPAPSASARSSSGETSKPDIKRVRYEVGIRQVRRGKLAVGIADGSVFADDACVYLAKDMRVAMIASAT